MRWGARSGQAIDRTLASDRIGKLKFRFKNFLRKDSAMKKNTLLAITFFSIAFFASGCNSVEVKRIPVDKPIDLSGQWNDTDARMVSQEMISSCLKGKWIERFSAGKGKKPVVIVGTVLNRSNEHIDPGVFVKSMEENLISSDKVSFVASKEERAEVREEREDQHKGLTEHVTINPKGKETGADFMLKGTIHTITDEINGKSVTYYQVTLDLVDLTNNQIEWIGKTELKKYIRRSKFGL